jgi:glycosyltransferase involved in cell wall biosynthesis
VHEPRIYFVLGTFLPLVGGAETQALAQARTLHRRGHATTILTLAHQRTWPCREVMHGVPVIRVGRSVLGGRERLPGLVRKPLYLCGLLAMAVALWRHRSHYDVIHVFQLNLVAVAAAVVCLLARKPLIVVVGSAGSGRAPGSHGRAQLLSGPLDTNSSWLQVEMPSVVAGDLAALEALGKPFVRCSRAIFERTGAIVVVLSTRMATYLSTHGFSLPGTQLIPNGVDTTQFRPAPMGAVSPSQMRTVVCVARLRYEKGVDVLIQAWSLVHQRVPDARLVVVGTGPIQPKLERMARELKIADRIEFAGLRSDIPSQLHRGRVAVLPSRWEGMPNALLEAMACGLACVATRVSGSEDLIEGEANGLLVEPEDHEALAQALLKVLHNPDLAARYGQAARSTVEMHYTLEHVTDLYASLYHRVTHAARTKEPIQQPQSTRHSWVSR